MTIVDRQVIEQLADSILVAHRSAQPVEVLSQGRVDLTVDEAYQVQLALADRRRNMGSRPVGWKVGGADPSIRQRLGLPEPFLGRLFHDELIDSGGTADTTRLYRPFVEAEIALIMGRRLEGPGVTLADVMAATWAVAPALEIGVRRVRDRPMLQEIIADNGGTGGAVLGSRMSRPEAMDLRLVGVVLEHNGRLAGTGAGAAAGGHPAAVVAWAANRLAGLGLALEPGDIVLTGSLTVAPPAAPGDIFAASFDRLGLVTVVFV